MPSDSKHARARDKGIRCTGQGDTRHGTRGFAALDTLLTTLRKVPSEFMAQDLLGMAHPVETIAFADDLLSIESTMDALQAKSAHHLGLVLAHGD